MVIVLAYCFGSKTYMQLAQPNLTSLSSFQFQKSTYSALCLTHHSILNHIACMESRTVYRILVQAICNACVLTVHICMHCDVNRSRMPLTVQAPSFFWMSTECCFLLILSSTFTINIKISVLGALTHRGNYWINRRLYT